MRVIESNGAYIISWSVVKLLRTILITTYQPKWKAKIEEAMDSFIVNIDSYPIEEFDVMLSLFEGGEYNELNTGAFGKQFVTPENHPPHPPDRGMVFWGKISFIIFKTIPLIPH